MTVSFFLTEALWQSVETASDLHLTIRIHGEFGTRISGQRKAYWS
jgi:hypothetical protein